MKTLQTLGLFVLLAFGALAQPSPDDFYITGYVTDYNGMALANQQVCVAIGPNNVPLSQDTLCSLTNANGWYSIVVPNGSTTGPNIDYTIFTYEQCLGILLSESRSNFQGTIDTAMANFSVCAANTGCSASFSFTVDTVASGIYVYTFEASGTGQAPLFYEWWIDGSTYTSQTVTHTFQGGMVGVYLTVTGADSCVAFTGDTLFLDGNQTGCSANILVNEDSLNNVLNAELTAIATGVAPFTYSWSTGDSTESIYLEDLIGLDSVCVTITDASGCTAVACDIVGFEPAQVCSVEITTTLDSSLNGAFYTLTASSGFVSYDWFNNQTGQSITVQNPDPNGDLYCVVATDANGCVATACDTLWGAAQGTCDVTIISEQDSANPYLFWLTAVPSGTGPFTYSWDNGATGQSVMYQIPGNGLYGACVTVTDATGCTSFNCDTLSPINNPGCFADFISSANPNSVIEAGDTLSLTYTGSQSFFNYYFWTVQGNGMFMNSFDENPQFILPSAGSYEVCVSVTDSITNCVDTYCETVIVQGGISGGCNADFSFSEMGSNFTFTAQQQNPGLYYLWNIDNQVLAEGAGDFEAVATNLSAGVHTVCLIVIDSLNNNCTDSQCLTFTVGSSACLGYVYGQVFAGTSSQPLDNGVVYLIAFDPMTNQLTAIDSMPLDSGNYYFFGPLACGDYLIKAAAYPNSQYYNGYIPTYHGNSPFWGFAQTVSLGQPNAQLTADVTLIAANNPGGPGFIGGDVNQGANKVDAGEPLAGMQVMLFDMSGNAIEYMYTDANGDFGFGDLAYGSYQVYVEKLGVVTEPAFVTIGPDNPSVDDISIYVSETLISTGINEFDFDGAISEVYPNPVARNASINFNLETEVMVNIHVLDLTGRTVSISARSISSGENQVRFDVDGLTEGYYFLNIQDVDGTFSVTRKFMRVGQ